MLRLFLDRRIGGLVRYHLCREGEQLPQVPLEVLNCVAFLYPSGGRRPEGTVFFVSISEHDPKPTEPDAFYCTYAVTAAHVIKSLKGKRAVDIRFNRREKGTRRVVTNISDWDTHPSTDVAVLPRIELPEDVDCVPFPLRVAVNDNVLRENSAGPGEDVFISGLFTQRPGEFRNTPIIRIGSLAALPGEPIQTPYDGTWPAYLIEARSTPAMSGCPVFLSLTGIRHIQQGLHAEAAPVGRTVISTASHLLGVGHGHYNDIRRNSPKRMIEKINTGIALVVPVERIFDLTDSRKENEMRKKDIARKPQNDSKNISADRTR